MEPHFHIAEFAFSRHANTNHLYDGYLPYKFHLTMVAGNANRYMELMVPKNEFPEGDWGNRERNAIRHIIYSSCWCHDLIEDARINYAELRETIKIFAINSGGFSDEEKVAAQVADIVFAVSNEKGKNRHERESDKYFQGIRDTECATFVKLCDRMANIEYSKMTAWKSKGKLEMYRKEHARFKEQLYAEKYHHIFAEMDYLLK